ncbi:hypothetical protein ElyMa_005304100 [Elysia marginata]|uniref:Uncharacterized protein n=1 Tax=Elysia marginata TaxID=1093978 RepID=A0AAV4K4M6_9GAST|nr:hypothetical protein ElyMa_005304100 [Elysia marginata]
MEIRETRWTGNGRLTLGTEETMLYSDHADEEDANHTEGVGLMLSRQAAKSLLGWQPEGSRIVSAMFKTNKKKINLRVINCYAPTNEKREDKREEYAVEVSNRFYALETRGDVEDIEDYWNKIKGVWKAHTGRKSPVKPLVGKNTATTNGGGDEEKKVEMDWAHFKETRQCITRHILVWNPQGCRARGRPRMTWRRETEAEMSSAEKTWRELEEMSQDGWCGGPLLATCASWGAESEE